MIRYWFEFERDEKPVAGVEVAYGCGVTAYDESDAKDILKETVFKNRNLPSIKKMIANVDMSTLDQEHVIPNMTNILKRGIWFPAGHEFIL